MTLFDECNTFRTRSSKVETVIENALKCCKELWNQKIKTETQVSMKGVFKQQYSAFTSASSRHQSYLIKHPLDHLHLWHLSPLTLMAHQTVSLSKTYNHS